MRSVGGISLARGRGQVEWNFGVKSIGAPDHIPTFAAAAPQLKGDGDGRVTLLYEAARTVMGRDLDPGPQKIGDCVSWGWGGSGDLVACVQAILGETEYSWEHRNATEAIYALSRVEVGGQRGSYSDGSTGEWAAAAVSRYGTLSRKELGAYDPRRAKEWGARGLPDELEPKAREHLIKTVTLVTTFEEACDAIANGYPIPICSNVGFQTGSGAATRRDQYGFSRSRGRWSHCMKFIAARQDSRPGLLCMQSWGDDGSAEGPKGEFDIPNASWWVYPEDCNKILRQRDSYVVSNYIGYKRQLLPWVF
jgi:hypothetical protein